MRPAAAVWQDFKLVAVERQALDIQICSHNLPVCALDINAGLRYQTIIGGADSPLPRW